MQPLRVKSCESSTHVYDFASLQVMGNSGMLKIKRKFPQKNLKVKLEANLKVNFLNSSVCFNIQADQLWQLMF